MEIEQTTAANSEKQAAWKIKAALTADKGASIFVALDVLKKTYHVAIWKNGSLAVTWVAPANDDQVVASLEPARAAIKKVVYEAGPTDYQPVEKVALHQVCR